MQICFLPTTKSPAKTAPRVAGEQVWKKGASGLRYGAINITYFRELRAQGMDVAEAVFRGAEQRMRPMLMTALSAGVGLFPAAISHGIGSQVQRPLATVMVGGMFIGPLLLLVVAPALRRIFLARETAETPAGEDVPDAEPT